MNSARCHTLTRHDSIRERIISVTLPTQVRGRSA